MKTLIDDIKQDIDNYRNEKLSNLIATASNVSIKNHEHRTTFNDR